MLKGDRQIDYFHITLADVINVNHRQILFLFILNNKEKQKMSIIRRENESDTSDE